MSSQMCGPFSASMIALLGIGQDRSPMLPVEESGPLAEPVARMPLLPDHDPLADFPAWIRSRLAQCNITLGRQ